MPKRQRGNKMSKPLDNNGPQPKPKVHQIELIVSLRVNHCELSELRRNGSRNQKLLEPKWLKRDPTNDFQKGM